MTKIDQLAGGIYRISSYWPQFGISINQFLIADEAPALIHTGTHPMYDDVHKAVSQILDPAKLAYVIVPHFEADECGGMYRFVKGSPKSTLVCSDTGAAINFSAWNYDGPYKGVRDGDRIELGKHTLRFLETPHVHHWDSMMVVEESTASLFPADLFIQPGEQPATTTENLSNQMCELFRGAGIFAAAQPVLDVVDRLPDFKLNWIHPMHGASLPRETHDYYTSALRTQPFTYEQVIFGRKLFT